MAEQENDSQERGTAQLLVMKTLSVGRIIYPTVRHKHRLSLHIVSRYEVV